MKIEIRATYPASDGSMPEDVVIEFDDFTQMTYPAVMADLVVPIIDRLMTVTRQPYTTTRPDEVQAVAESQGWAEPPHEHCLHAGCHHLPDAHSNLTADGDFIGERFGACEICNDNRVCPAYVREAKA